VRRLVIVRLMLVTFGILLMGHVAPAQAQLYDDFNATKIDPDKWVGVQAQDAGEEGGLRLIRRIELDGTEGHLVLSHRVVGGTFTNTGLRISRNRLRIVQDPNAITAVRFDVMVRDFSMLGCSASSSVSGVRAGFIGFLFNDGSSTDPQDATGDIIGIVGLSRISSSTDSTGIVRAVGILARCIERTCSGQLTTFTVLDLGPVATGETVTLAMNWDRVEKKLDFQKNAEAVHSIAYTQDDSRPPIFSLKALEARGQAANCTVGPRPFADVTGVFDNVLVFRTTNARPVANAQSVTTPEDTAISVVLTGGDAETTATNLTYTVVSGTTKGALTDTGQVRTYTPNADFSGTDSFTFVVTDRGAPDNCGTPGPSCAAALTSAPATVTITVTPVNDPPVLTVPGPMTVNEGTAISFTLSATDVDGPFPLIFSASNLPTGATLTPQSGTSALFAWTPNSAQGGSNPYLVQFTVSDGQLSDTKVVSITVNDTIADRDGDGIPDALDNCPDEPNPTQTDVCHNSPQPVAPTQTVTQVDGQIPVTFTATVTNDKTDISFLPPSLFTVNCRVINNATGSVVPVGQIPESGPFVLNLGEVNRPGDLVKIAAGATATFSTTFDLRTYYPNLPNGSFTTICTYVQFGQILNPTADDPPLWTGEIQAPPQTVFVGQYQFVGFFSPLPSAKVTQRKTVPVKFALKDSTGAFVTNCTCTLAVQPLDSSGNPSGPAFPAIPTSGSSDQFKYDVKNNQYVFNLSGKSLPLGRVQLQTNLHDGSQPRTLDVIVTR